jgi:hypothetical protein
MNDNKERGETNREEESWNMTWQKLKEEKVGENGSRMITDSWRVEMGYVMIRVLY